MSAGVETVTIVGGGLAGLSLGLALRARDIPVCIHEAGTYPRHRICGEFLCGQGPAVIERLAGPGILADAVSARDCAWFGPAGSFYRRALPVAARNLSRYALDARLAGRFEELGGTIQTSSRVHGESSAEGRVWAVGRKPAQSGWMGIKQHYRGLVLSADLEMHCGRGGYFGVCKVEDDSINVCGLFRVAVKRGDTPRQHLPAAFARQVGLDQLADRLDAAEAVGGSLTGVSGLAFGYTRTAEFSIGDAFGQIPPFSGNGMSMALEAGEIAAGPLAAYAHGDISWGCARTRARSLLKRAFRVRLFTGRALHPLIWHAWGTGMARTLARMHVLPFGLTVRLTR